MILVANEYMEQGDWIIKGALCSFKEANKNDTFTVMVTRKRASSILLDTTKNKIQITEGLRSETSSRN